ncbi:hypothetical protein ABBQ32_011527 [Trebouxia sp. C0010 RCD-2024]
MAAACSIADLPTDVLQRILAALTRQPGSTLDICSCLSVCKRWNSVGSCQEYWQHIDVSSNKKKRLSGRDLVKLVARSSSQVLSLNLQECHIVDAHTIMQVLLSSQHLEEVDLSYCEQVAIHNIEFFLESVIERPNPKLKKLTIGYLGGCRPQDFNIVKQKGQAAGVQVNLAPPHPRYAKLGRACLDFWDFSER